MSSIRKRIAALRASGERGSITITVIGMVIALMMAIGLVVDGGGKLRAIEQANAAAAQAARIAVQQLDLAQAQGAGAADFDTAAATTAAQQALAAQDAAGTVSIVGDEVTVTTTVTYDTALLSIIGINQLTGEGAATARVAEGVTSG